MCGRSSLTKNEKEIEHRFNATFYSEELERYNPLPNYNIAPTHMCPIIINEDTSHIHVFRWGLIPFWAKDLKIGFKMINARSETLEEKPFFKNCLASKRCLVPLDGFYEWTIADGKKQPHRIQVTDQEIFSVAGLWDKWKDPVSNHIIYSFTIITLPANPFMAHIHDRMPAILSVEKEHLWLEDGLPLSEYAALLSPYPSEMMTSYEVSTAVNNVKNNSPELVLRRQ